MIISQCVVRKPKRNDLNRRRVAIIVIVALFIGVLSLVPTMSERITLCPPLGGCPYVPNQSGSMASATYYLLGVGGRIVAGHYQVAYLPGWACHQTSSEVTVSFANGTIRVKSVPGTECSENVITVA